jgi:hypothetical protein
MNHVRRLLLLAGVLAVLGFGLVAAGTQGDEPTDPAASGWYANPPDWSMGESDGAYSSTLSMTFDDERGVSLTALVGFGLVGLSILICVGVIGFGVAGRPRPSL